MRTASRKGVTPLYCQLLILCDIKDTLAALYIPIIYLFRMWTHTVRFLNACAHMKSTRGNGNNKAKWITVIQYLWIGCSLFPAVQVAAFAITAHCIIELISTALYYAYHHYCYYSFLPRTTLVRQCRLNRKHWRMVGLIADHLQYCTAPPLYQIHWAAHIQSAWK